MPKDPTQLAATAGTITVTCTNASADGATMQAGTIAIGRHRENDIRIKDDVASRFHCVIESSSRGFVLRDLGSRNGTRHNGESVARSLLADGDTVAVGRHTFAIAIVAAPSTPSAPPRNAPTANGDAAGAPATPPPKPAADPPPAPPAEPGPPPGDIPLEGRDDQNHRRERQIKQPARRERIRSKRPDGGDRTWADTIRTTIAELSSGAGEHLKGELRLINADGSRSQALEGKTPGPSLARLLLFLAARSRATDIHLEPKRDHVIVRVRIDGTMTQIVELPPAVGESGMGLFRTACQFPQAHPGAVLDGHFGADVASSRVDYRASFTPTVHGTKLVIRVLDPRTAPQSLNDLHLPRDVQTAIERLCDSDAGMLLAAGPTGSGKTTTLYNAIRYIDRDARNVVTIEDPVEYDIEGTTQIPVSERQRFGALLRSVLRQDPDVILVGEIRDQETARTASEAALTGHVVFSTVHAKDSFSSVFRLLDLGVDQYLVANSIQLIIAQRLIKVLCKRCKRPVRVTPSEASRIGRFLKGAEHTFVATGCGACLRTGYAGRRGLYEALNFNDELRDCVLSNPSIQAMKRIVGQTTFRTLQQAGWELAAKGITSLDEVERVSAMD